MEQATTTNMCEECHILIEGCLRTHKQNVHQRTATIKVTFDGQTLTYKLDRQPDNEFHCPCGNASRPSAKNIGNHCRACKTGFTAELARIAALRAYQAPLEQNQAPLEANQTPLETDQALLSDEGAASSGEGNMERQNQEQDGEDEQENEATEGNSFEVSNEIGKFHGIFNSTLYSKFGVHIHIASGAIICQKCTIAVELNLIYKHLTEATHGYSNSEAKSIGKVALIRLLTANGAKEYEQMGLYYEPTVEKLDWIPILEVYQGHVCKICYEENIWVASKSWNTMKHHFTKDHIFMGREGNTFAREMQTVFGHNKAKYFGIKDHQQSQQIQLSTTAAQQQQSFFERNPAAKTIITLNHYGDDAEIMDHRDKLTNSFIEHFKLQAFFDEFRVIEGVSSMQLRKVLNRFISRERRGLTPVYDSIRRTAHTFFQRVNHILTNSDVGYFWRRQVKSMKDNELTTRGLNALQPATLEKYVNIWVNMIIMLARTIYEDSAEGEEEKTNYLAFDMCRLMDDYQRQCLKDLICEAKERNDKTRMEMLLLNLNLSIFSRHVPSQNSVVNNITEKCPSLAFCNLYFLKSDGSFRNLRDVTKAHAIMIYCFRATTLYSIFTNEKIINLDSKDEMGETMQSQEDNDHPAVEYNKDELEDTPVDLELFGLIDPFGNEKISEQQQQDNEFEFDDFDMDAYAQLEGSINPQHEEREDEYQRRRRNELRAQASPPHQSNE